MNALNLKARVVRRLYIFTLQTAHGLLFIPTVIFWQFAAWRLRIATRIENEKANNTATPPHASEGSTEA